MSLLTEMVDVSSIDTPKQFAALTMALLAPICGSVAVAWATATFAHRKKLGAIAADTGAIREQTENDHETNMRVDLDEILKGIKRIEEQQGQQARDIGGLREEMRTERTERGRADQHIRELIERWPH
ncbi:DUF2746 domain-containing protein [Mycobacteroides abscessus subsp. abscessus]|uniref:DUF2746 domain-containing protein n=1 Tax=Mycobacteroides abscessus TaxID=36809 RepID=UPI0002317A5E|nr:DUF2746 domain-containing protein [Mycobacteroides abscessus]QST89255.1 hypothetical protein PROPHIGD44-1_69 [Mycobacterium phage prophiGD44-1]QST90652.1 hypothetical protein PROPHIGD52-1_69 [Mycobacterium phage prophi52-1]ALM18090.1 hypothetical protein AOY11_19170 [Mycobacteroides abscessus]AMU52149.1 hypothetical protein A3O01_19785 [Mycobacteroides abscessus]ANO10833.1 hypothetical protein BAB76_19795 [Mycobacteroides abscessus]